MKKACFFVFLLLLAVSFPFPAGADTVKLKNDGSLTGVIEQEDETSITLEIGMGMMRIQRTEIESIRKADKKENDLLESIFRKTGIEKGTFVPPGLEEMAQKLKDIPDDRKNVDDAKRQLDSLRQELDSDSNKFGSMRADFEKKNKEVHAMDPQSDVQKYNNLITELNMISVDISSLSEELNKLGPKESEYERLYWKALTDYGNEIGDFRIYFEKQSELLKKRGMTADESLYLETVNRSFAAFEKGLNRDAVTVSKAQGGMAVKAVLNGEVTCLLAVDTGAAVVVISKDVADRLEVNPGDSAEDVQFTLADGSVIKSKVIKIKSVRVGNSTVYNVATAVTDNPPGVGVDGLLGMSFLSNFNIKMDPSNGKLILETMK